MSSYRNILVNYLSTQRAHLTRATRINCYYYLASFFRFARKSFKQLRPCCVSYTLAVFLLFQHAINIQVLDGHEIVSMNKIVCGFVTKIIPAVLNPLMDQSHGPSGTALVGATLSLRELRVSALDRCQSLFISLKEPLSFDLKRVARHNKGLQTHIKACNLPRLGQGTSAT